MRTAIFWCHLTAGTLVGIVVLIMSATGVALAYERQTLEWSAARHRLSVSAVRDRLPLDTLVARVRGATGEQSVFGLTLRAHPGMPVSVTLPDRSSLFLDPYTGDILGGDAALQRVFAAAERIHRSITFLGSEQSEVGTAITGAANLAFLFLILSGFVLWWPRRWSGHAFRGILLFTRGAWGKARDWNWHHVLGFWSAPVLALIAISAAFISYPWPQALVERAFGEAPRPVPASGAIAPAPGPAHLGAGRASLDTAWAAALRQAGPWHSAELRLPAKAGQPLAATISHTGAFRPTERSRVTLDPSNGAVVERIRYQELGPGARVRGWMRALHTGEAGGIPGQTIAAAVSAGATVLVWTGLALAWRRMRTALRRREVPRASEGGSRTG